MQVSQVRTASFPSRNAYASHAMERLFVARCSCSRLDGRTDGYASVVVGKSPSCFRYLIAGDISSSSGSVSGIEMRAHGRSPWMASIPSLQRTYL